MAPTCGLRREAEEGDDGTEFPERRRSFGDPEKYQIIEKEWAEFTRLVTGKHNFTNALKGTKNIPPHHRAKWKSYLSIGFFFCMQHLYETNSFRSTILRGDGLAKEEKTAGNDSTTTCSISLARTSWRSMQRSGSGSFTARKRTAIRPVRALWQTQRTPITLITVV